VGLSRTLKEKIDALSLEDIDRMVRMGWEDRTTFDAILFQFGFTENEFVKFMRTKLSSDSFTRWRRRAHEQGHLKHEVKRGFKKTRFKCRRQSIDGVTKGWK